MSCGLQGRSVRGGRLRGGSRFCWRGFVGCILVDVGACHVSCTVISIGEIKMQGALAVSPLEAEAKQTRARPQRFGQFDVSPRETSLVISYRSSSI